MDIEWQLRPVCCLLAAQGLIPIYLGSEFFPWGHLAGDHACQTQAISAIQCMPFLICQAGN